MNGFDVVGAVRALRHTGLVAGTGHVIGSRVTSYGGGEDLVLDGVPGRLEGDLGGVEVWRPEVGRVVRHSTFVDRDSLVTEVYGERLPRPVSALALLSRLAAVVPAWSSWSDGQIVAIAEQCAAGIDAEGVDLGAIA